MKRFHLPAVVALLLVSAAASAEEWRAARQAYSPPVRLGRPQSTTAPAVRLGAPAALRRGELLQVGLTSPVSSGSVVRAQNPAADAEGELIMHPPAEAPLPGGPVSVGPVLSSGPVAMPGPGVPVAHPTYFGGFSPFFARCAAWCGCCPGLEVSAGFYVLQPHWDTNPAYSVTRTLPGNVTAVMQEDFQYDHEFAPLLTIGYTGPDGLGVRARAWRFDQSAAAQVINDGSLVIRSAAPLGLTNTSTTSGDLLRFDSDLRIHVVDLELTQNVPLGMWQLKFAGGGRYAQLSQSYNHIEFPQNGLVDAISSGHQFRGAGPSIAVEARRPIGCRGLSLYASGRGAMLFGTGKQNSFAVVNNGLANVASTSRDDLLPITELEIGGELCKDLGCCRLFVQAAVVGQVWYGAGNAANNDLIPVLVDPEVSDNDTNLGLFGGKLIVGLEF